MMLLKRELLRAFEWHDLPVEELTISNDGAALVVTPYSEALQRYRRLRLSLSSPKELQVTITGSLAVTDLSTVEISSFAILEEDDDRLSGRLAVLPGAAGMWEIAFKGAAWQLVDLDGRATGAKRRLVAYLVSQTATDARET